MPPIVPTGHYYTPALQAMQGPGFFEGALGGFRAIQAQDFRQEQLRSLRAKRNADDAALAATLTGQLGVGDPLSDLMGLSPQAAGGRAAARPRATSPSSGPSGTPVTALEVQDAAKLQDQLAILDRLTREYEQARGQIPPAGPVADVRGGEIGDGIQTGVPADYSDPALAAALVRGEIGEDPGSMALRHAVGGAAAPQPEDDDYRARIAAMSDEEFAAEDSVSKMLEGAYQDAMALDPTGLEAWIAGRPSVPLASPEGYSQADLADYAQALTQPTPSMGARAADPIGAAMAEKPKRDRRELESAYQQLQTGVRDAAMARRSGDRGAANVADLAIRDAMEILPDELIEAMNVVGPSTGREWEPEPERLSRERGERLRMRPEFAPTPGYEGVENVATRLGLSQSTVLDPQTMAAIGSLASAGDPRADSLMRNLGMDPVQAKKEFREGFVGDLQEYRTELARKIEQDQEVLKQAGASPDERAKFFIRQVNMTNEGLLDPRNPKDIEFASYMLTLPVRERLELLKSLEGQRKADANLALQAERLKMKKQVGVTIHRYDVPRKERALQYRIAFDAFAEVFDAQQKAILAYEEIPEGSRRTQGMRDNLKDLDIRVGKAAKELREAGVDVGLDEKPGRARSRLELTHPSVVDDPSIGTRPSESQIRDSARKLLAQYERGELDAPAFDPDALGHDDHPVIAALRAQLTDDELEVAKDELAGALTDN